MVHWQANFWLSKMDCASKFDISVFLFIFWLLNWTNLSTMIDPVKRHMKTNKNTHTHTVYFFVTLKCVRIDQKKNRYFICATVNGPTIHNWFTTVIFSCWKCEKWKCEKSVLTPGANIEGDEMPKYEKNIVKNVLNLINDRQHTVYGIRMYNISHLKLYRGMHIDSGRL